MGPNLPIYAGDSIPSDERFGDRAGDFYAGSGLPSGSKTIAVDVYSGNNLQGKLLGIVNRSFTIDNDLT